MRTPVLLLAAVTALAACSGHDFLDERRALPYAGLLDQGSTLRRSTTRILASPPGADPLWLAVEHVAARESPPAGTLVLVPGVFSSRSTWRFLVGPLGQRHDLLLTDPPGTGRSDKPSPRTSPEAYSPQWLAAHELRALEAWALGYGNRGPVTLVGHSLGAASVLRMVSDPELAALAPSFLARVRGLVLISPPDVVVEQVPPTLEGVATISGVTIDMARVVGLYGSNVKDGVWGSQYDPCRSALGQDVAAMKQIVGSCDTRLASQAMLRRYNPLRADGQIDRAHEARLRVNLQRVRIPVLVVVGEADDTLPPENGRRLVATLPRARLVVVPKAKHSPHVERASEVADAISRFLGLAE